MVLIFKPFITLISFVVVQYSLNLIEKGNFAIVELGYLFTCTSISVCFWKNKNNYMLVCFFSQQNFIYCISVFLSEKYTYLSLTISHKNKLATDDLNI